MTRLSFSAALKELNARNASITAAYKDWARRLPPGPASRLASSVAAQRQDLGASLAELASNRMLSDADLELETAPASAAGFDTASTTMSDPKSTLQLMAETEAAEHELLAEIAGAILPVSTKAADLLASEAASARKRSMWAQDQLELISLG